jgi:hypothetical protein
MRRIFGDKESAGFSGCPVERVHDETLVGGMLERGRGLLPLARSREVGLCVRKRVQLRGAAGKGKRERKEQPVENPPGHALIIHARQTRTQPRPINRGLLRSGQALVQTGDEQVLGQFLADEHHH